MTTSIYKFSKDTGIPKSTVTDKVKSLNWPTDKGLTDTQVEELLVIFKDRLPQDTAITPTSSAGTVTSGLTTTPSVYSSDLSTYSPVEVVTPLEFVHLDNSQHRSAIAEQVLATVQQSEANRQAIEQAVIRRAEERGAELALRAYQAEQAAYTQVQSGLQVSGAEVLGLIKKQQSEES